MENSSKTISGEEFDRLFDEGETNMTPYIDLASAKRINPLDAPPPVKDEDAVNGLPRGPGGQRTR
jgi:hypothetical protein